MIRSMTGYARVERVLPKGKLSLELRAVNSRYLDLSLKLPEDFRALEGELRQAVSAAVSRGKLELGLRYHLDTATQSAIHLDTQRLHAVREALDNVAEVLGATLAADPVRVLGFPGVVREEVADTQALQVEAVAGMADLLTAFNEARAREGARTAQHLRERAAALREQMAVVRSRAPLVRAAWLERLTARLAELGAEVEPQRLAQESVMAAQRLDVDEELSRLESHLTELDRILKGKDAVGRRLDFLMQEFNREANTTGSKSQDAEMTRAVVEMKVLIEQMREQIQNLE